MQRRFILIREEDETGISGTGCVADGVSYRDGQIVMRWRNTGTIQITKDMNALLAIHGHNGKTRVVFIDPEVREYSNQVKS